MIKQFHDDDDVDDRDNHEYISVFHNLNISNGRPIVK